MRCFQKASYRHSSPAQPGTAYSPNTSLTGIFFDEVTFRATIVLPYGPHCLWSVWAAALSARALQYGESRGKVRAPGGVYLYDLANRFT